MKKEVSNYLAKIAKKGGSAGHGAAKRRTREQCQAAANARWAKHKLPITAEAALAILKLSKTRK